MKVFRVGSEFYDRAWYIKTDTRNRALQFVMNHIDRNWPDGLRSRASFEIEEILEENKVYEGRDL